MHGLAWPQQGWWVLMAQCQAKATIIITVTAP